jgi:glycosyltransferase involved in cell wall biosynthesis
VRVLLVNDYAPPVGGAEVQTLALRDALRERGHDVRLFASTAERDGTRPDYACFGTTSRLRGLVQTANPAAYLALRRTLAEFRPAVVHVRIFLTQLSPLILPLLRDVPSIYHVAWYRAVCPIGTKLLPDGTECTVRAGVVCRRNGCLPSHEWTARMAQRGLLRRWLSAFDRILAIGEGVERHLRADGIDGVQLFPNAIPDLPARPPLVGPPLVAFAGRLTREKGVDVLLRAFASTRRRIPEARLVVAGEGPERARLEGLAHDLGLAGHATFAGKLARTELERMLAGAWAQALPSIWREPFGNAAGEALMRGTALVASETAGVARLIDDPEAAVLVAPGDVDRLADALARVLGDREVAERIGARGRAFALDRLSYRAYVDRVVELYAELTDTSSRTGGR